MILMMKLMLFMFSSIMFFIIHPLSMGLMILMQTLLICLISGLFINTYWFAYILFLTFLGGMLILFIYVSSIASNELFKFSIKMINSMLMISLLIMMTMIMFKSKLTTNFALNKEMEMFYEKFIFFNNENKFNLLKLYNNENYLMMMMIIYLLITLIAVVKITNNILGPLRQMN